MFKKKPPASNDVCSYIHSSRCVCVVVQGRAVFTAHVKNKCVMMIDEEYTICLRFPRKNGIHRSCSGKWNGLLVMILTCCERSKAHSRFAVSVMEKILISEFLDSLKIRSNTCRKPQLHRQKLNWILRLAHGGDCLRLAERSL